MSGGNGGGRNYQPQDNSYQIMQAQLEYQRQKDEEDRAAREQARQNEIIRWQNQINYEKEQDQIAENRRIVKAAQDKKDAADAEYRQWQHDYELRVAARAERDAETNRQDTLRANAKAEEDAKEARRIANARQAAGLADTSFRSLAQSRIGGGPGTEQLIAQALAQADMIKSGIPEGDPNPGAYYNPSFIDSLVTGEEGRRRTGSINQVNTTFAPGYEKNYIPDTADDSYINDLLTSRRTDAQKAIDNARSRGQLNDAGYAGAQARLDQQGKAAQSTLTHIGDSLLATRRAGLEPIRTSASSAASGYTWGGPSFDISPFTSQLASKASESLKGLEGDITNAVGNTPLFDVNEILLSGGRGQGPVNLTTASVPGRLRRRDTDRGLGTTGAF